MATHNLNERDRIAGLWFLASGASDRATAADARRAAEELTRLEPVWVAEAGERLLLARVETLWRNGWQPSELQRRVHRSSSADAARLVLHVIAADHAERAPDSLDPRWVAQLDVLELPRVQRHGWLRAFAATREVAWPNVAMTAIDLARCLMATRPLPMIVPPPGHPGNDRIDLTSPVDDPILARVRALLAQAESTTFEAEAETFTAKAQELMTRHAIDEALLDARGRPGDAPTTQRIAIDDPYADAKSLLAQLIAEQTRCRAVFDPTYSLTSIVGLASDVAATELLFTSLLVQGAIAMRAASANAPAGARTRSRGYRASFWVAYATRVGERLSEINDGMIHDADLSSGGALLPVLADRSERVDAAVDAMFGALVEGRVRSGYDPAGWARGTIAADGAQLSKGGAIAPG